MRSRPDARLQALIAAAVLIAALPPAAASAREPSAQAATGSPEAAEIVRAIETVKADPNLATELVVKTLRWRNSEDATPSARPAWLTWIAGLFGWLERSARVLVWCVALLLAGVVAVFVVRLVRRDHVTLRRESLAAPTHVRSLDIRPESLPDDIGAAARALWDRGEHRAALALLYRGMLSRLAHVHRIAIRESSTEGDCLTLAAGHLTPRQHQYASGLVAVWQRAVYGREEVEPATVYGLSDGFAGALDHASPPGSVAPEGTP